jgi:hypothetical protein
MTTLTAPIGRSAASGPGLLPAFRVTVRQHRTALGGLLILLAGYAVICTIIGVHLHDQYARYLQWHCVTSQSARCLGLAFRIGNSVASGVTRSMLGIPAVIGMFAGAPLLAREFETGTSRFARTQGVSLSRQLVRKLLVLGAATVLVTCAVSLAGTWWFRPSTQLGYSSRWETMSFNSTAVTLPAWALLGFALGVLAGAVIRRTVPAMIAALAGIAAAMLAGGPLTRTVLRIAALPGRSVPGFDVYGPVRWSHGKPVATGPFTAYVSAPDGTATSRGGWQVSWWLTGAHGQHLSSGAIAVLAHHIPLRIALASSRARVHSWLAGRHLTFWIGYQPASRYWLFQVVLAAILVALAAAAAALTVRLVRAP